MATPTELFLSAADAAADLLASDAVAAAWDEPSALEAYTVAGLAGHLARAVLVVETYLDADDGAGTGPVPDRLIDAAEYFAVGIGEHDPITSELHQAVRARGEATSADGPAALAATVRAAAGRLRDDLDDAAVQRPLTVFGGLALRLEDYLGTRLVELVVHIDDLAVSVDAPAPDLPEEAYLATVGILAGTAARRDGALAAVRALARRERHPEALRAF